MSSVARPAQDRSAGLRHVFLPKLLTTLRDGYSLGNFRSDVIAGLTVSIVALPLAMALAIASGATPNQGLITAVVAGLLISALGGSRYLIGGPTGAFVVVVFNVIQQHGYDGLVLATLMAGLMLLVAGFARLGSWIKYIPLPVITGFTSGIAVIIVVSQIGDLLGLDPRGIPGEVYGKLHAYASRSDAINFAAVSVSVGTLALMLALRRWVPRLPAPLIGIAAATAVVTALALPVETIHSRFGDFAFTWPDVRLPTLSFERVQLLLPSAFTIAFLAGVESLLCAVVADSMTGARHRSNTELIGQGIANCASALCGGLPATGAIARTATNVRAGAQTPMAGVLHALFVLAFALMLAPLIGLLPLSACAAVLLVVAWNMSEIERFRHLLSAPLGDRVVLLLTFALTIAVDLTVAIEVGVVLASILFMHRMSEAVRLQSHESLLGDGDGDEEANGAVANGDASLRASLPHGVEYLELHGPFFFGVANLFADVMARIEKAPYACVLVLREVPLVDASGVSALRDFADRCRKRGTELIIAEMQPAVRESLARMGVFALPGVSAIGTAEEGLRYAARLAEEARDD
jgi:SulP family sulfate permease